jgi:hypothetical protein
MLRFGLVTSLPRQDGNTVGVSFLASELVGQRQDRIRRMAALADSNRILGSRLQALEDATHTLVGETGKARLDEGSRLGRRTLT